MEILRDTIEDIFSLSYCDSVGYISIPYFSYFDTEVFAD